MGLLWITYVITLSFFKCTQSDFIYFAIHTKSQNYDYSKVDSHDRLKQK